MESKWLSMETIIENSPDAAPDERDRIIRQRGALIPEGSQDIQSNAEKANNMSVNRNDEIPDNVEKVVDVEPTTINT